MDNLVTIRIANCLMDGRGGYEQWPHWEHDCEKCVFLGHTHSGGDRDVWYCESSDTLIVRNSSDGPDYASFPLALAASAAQSEGPGTMWGEAVSRYDDAVGQHGTVMSHELDFAPNSVEKDEWVGEFYTVVGLYADLKVRKLDSGDFLIKDQHGNQLLRADWSEESKCFSVTEFASPDTSAYISYHHSRSALFLYAMLLQQRLVDSGH